MRNLAAQTFITSISDFEMSQYQLLSYLAKYKNDLKKFKLYPRNDDKFHSDYAYPYYALFDLHTENHRR